MIQSKKDSKIKSLYKIKCNAAEKEKRKAREKMAEKNRFSRLLKYLLSVADIKNYALAQELQYDVSYISKWTSGQMLPSEKYEKKILKKISSYIVDECSGDVRKKLISEYQVDNNEELKLAIYDNMEAEYFYVKNLQNDTGIDVAPKTFFFPEMTLSQYIIKMHHPVLRRVNALDIVGAFDLFAMEREYYLQIAENENEHVPKGKYYQDVHYSMLIHIEESKWDYFYDTIFLMDLLEKNSCVDFQLYAGKWAVGRVIFAVKDEYAISGVLLGKDRCLSVVASEDENNCNILYRNLMGLCSRERLLFRKTTMRNMIEKHEYAYALLSLKQKWIVGHFTEHFLPEDLFEEIISQLNEKNLNNKYLQEIYNAQQMIKKIIEESQIKLLFYKTALYNLVVDKKIDFYNCKINLTDNQIFRYLENFLNICTQHTNLEVKIISGKLITDIGYSENPCMFLSDTVSYLRFDQKENNLYIVNRSVLGNIFEKSFDTFWTKSDKDVVVEDKELITENIRHVMI